MPNVFCPVLARVICNPSRATDESVELLAVACVHHVDEATHARPLRPPWCNTPAPHTRRAPYRAKAKLRSFFDKFSSYGKFCGENIYRRGGGGLFFRVSAPIVCVCKNIREKSRASISNAAKASPSRYLWWLFCISSTPIILAVKHVGDEALVSSWRRDFFYS